MKMEIERTVSSTNHHSYRKFQHDHPNFKNILRMMNECNTIKYAAYRTAAKLRVLQRALHMDTLRLGLIVGVFDRHHLQVTENGISLEYSELEAVIFDIFFAAQKENLSRIDVDLTTELVLNLLLNVYDGKQSGTLQVLPVKVALTVFCSAELQKKYQYLFSQLADHNSCISSNKFEILLKNLTCITEYINESTTFGSKFITSTVGSCFQQSQGTLGITEDMFIGWLLHEPQLLVWLSAMYRMQVAEMVSHNVKCGACKVYPIVGLRYQCLDCLRYNLCQTCFFMGRVSKKHKLRHSMQEHCYEMSAKETTYTFMKMIRNKLCGNSSKLQYLSVQPYDVVFESSHSGDNVVLTPSHMHSVQNESDASTLTVLRGSEKIKPHEELQSIISQLEEGNRSFQQTVEKLSRKGDTSDMCERLQDHHILVETQVERLKLLKHYLLERPLHQLEHLQSTPLLSVMQKNRGTSCFDNISPIVKEMEADKYSTGMQELQLLTWQMKHDRQINENYRDQMQTTELNDISPMLPSVSDVSQRDLSTWVAERTLDRAEDKVPSRFSTWVQGSCCSDSKQKLEEVNGDLDGILQKLQEMLASGFILAESFSSRDNAELKQGMQEVEDLVTGLIKSVESQKQY